MTTFAEHLDTRQHRHCVRGDEADVGGPTSTIMLASEPLAGRHLHRTSAAGDADSITVEHASRGADLAWADSNAMNLDMRP
jgi:hypothetical protein